MLYTISINKPLNKRGAELVLITNSNKHPKCIIMLIQTMIYYVQNVRNIHAKRKGGLL